MNNSHIPAMPCVRKPSRDAIAQAEGVGMTLEDSQYSGLSKREHFAAMAMQALTTGSRMMNGDEEEYARLAVKSADALLKELEA